MARLAWASHFWLTVGGTEAALATALGSCDEKKVGGMKEPVFQTCCQELGVLAKVLELKLGVALFSVVGIQK